MEDCNPREDFDDGALNIKYVPLYPSQNSGLNQKLSDSRLPKVDSSNSHANHFLPKSEVIHHDDDNDDDDDVDYYEHLTRGKNSKNHHTKKKKPRSQSVECSSKRIKNEKFSMAYICRTKDTLGTLIIEKCVDLGITPGPLLGKLKNGEDITLENGTVVKSSDVKMPDVPGAVIIGTI